MRHEASPRNDLVDLGLDDAGNPLSVRQGILRRPVALEGDDPAGQREIVLRLLDGAVEAGGGAIVVADWSDPTLYAVTDSIARRRGRANDLLVLNLARGPAAGRPETDGHVSHALNPFSNLSAAYLASMIAAAEAEGAEDSIWAGRSTALSAAVLEILVWQRDHGGIRLDASTFVESLHMGAVYDLACGLDGAEVPRETRDPLIRYLASLPGFVGAWKEKQGNSTLSYHGAAQMALTRTVARLTENRTGELVAGFGDIDMDDVVRNRRILFVILPSHAPRIDLAPVVGFLTEGLRRAMAVGDACATVGSTVDYPRIFSDRSREPFLVAVDRSVNAATASLRRLAYALRSTGVGSVIGLRHDGGSYLDGIQGVPDDVVRISFDGTDGASDATGRFSIDLDRNVARGRTVPFRLPAKVGHEAAFDRLAVVKDLKETRRFHDRSTRSEEAMRDLSAVPIDRLLATTPLTFVPRLRSRPAAVSPVSMIEASFAVVGGYSKIRSLDREVEVDELVPLGGTR